MVTFVTGHDVPGIDWSKVGQSETLVIFMGIAAIREIAREIMTHGRSGDTPAIAVRWGTRPDQETVTGTLATIADRDRSSASEAARDRDHRRSGAIALKLSLVREAAAVRKTDCGDARARSGRRVLRSRLRSLGADAIELPVISIQPPEDPRPLDRAIGHLALYDWLIFTSVNGVQFFLDRLDHSDQDLRSLKARNLRHRTGHAASRRESALESDLMPEEYVAESLVEAFASERMQGKRVLLPRAAVASDLIPAELEKLGAHIDVVEAYRNVIPPDAARARS